MDRILESNEKRFRELERRAAQVIEAITNSGIRYEENEEVVDVCQAIQDMKMHAEQRGKLIGEQKLKELKAEYREILERLGRLEQRGIIGAFDKRTIRKKSFN